MKFLRIENTNISGNSLILFDWYDNHQYPFLLRAQIEIISELLDFLKLKPTTLFLMPVINNQIQQSSNFFHENIETLIQNLKKQNNHLQFQHVEKTPEKPSNEIIYIINPTKEFIPIIQYFDFIIIQSYRFLTELKKNNTLTNIENNKFCITSDVYETLYFIELLQNQTIKQKVGIFGGNQIEKTNLFLEACVKYFQTLLFGGSVGLHTLKANGVEIGNSAYVREEISHSFHIINKAYSEECEVLLPFDHIITDKITSKAKTKTSPREIRSPYQGIDIGSKTIEAYEEKIKNANLVFMHGPLGIIEIEKSKKGTYEILKILNKSKKPTLLTGYELTNFAKKENFSLKIVPEFEFFRYHLIT
ncbi:MAG: phosphoglycerate kinase [Leptospiraceae bacterium]|nr:phosphoglycerate kinase [Leptospiraceae bacterium]MDW7975774.1 phosphoglycerate kinase [Leptospiraceae bacterium]